jgi:hypothetical protein
MRMLEAITAGLISGFLSPFVLSWLRHVYIWKREKSLEQKYQVFKDAVRALALLCTDALDSKLQANKTSYKDTSRVTELRPETAEALEISTGMVKAFFSSETYAKYDTATKKKVGIENVPNTEFEEARVEAILAMASELGIAPNPQLNRTRADNARAG